MRNLHEVYWDIYQLVKHVGFSAEYVETISPGERELYKNYFVMESKESPNTKENENAAQLAGYKIEDLL